MAVTATTRTNPTASTLGRLPLHVQISEMLVREIQSGQLLDGEKLQPERQLASDLGISVGTLRKALLDLENKGFLRRVQGSGNYVQDNSDGENIYAFFHLETKRGGGLPTANALSVNRLRKPDTLPDIGASADAYRIRRTRVLGTIDAAVEEIWLDVACAKTLTIEDVSDALYLFYRQSLGIVISRATDSVSVAEKPDWTPADFGTNEHPTWGYVERLSQDQSGRDIEFSRTWFDPATTRFVARWR